MGIASKRKSPEPCGFGLLLGHYLSRSVGTGCDGSETWIRTMIHGFKGRCPAFRRSRKARTLCQTFSLLPRTIALILLNLYVLKNFLTAPTVVTTPKNERPAH